MSSQPTSGYYQFVVAVTGDSRLVANHVEVREGLERWGDLGVCCLLIMNCLLAKRLRELHMNIKRHVKYFSGTLILSISEFPELTNGLIISSSVLETSILVHYLVINLRKSFYGMITKCC